MTPVVGPKLRDGLRAYAEMDRLRRESVFPFADAILVEMGYPQKVAESIIARLASRGWIEYGVSARTGWLTDDGWARANEVSQLHDYPVRRRAS